MSTEQVPQIEPIPTARIVLPRVELNNGDRMDREEFHRLYEQTPDGFKAELIGGIVYVASPLKYSHGRPHLLLGSVFAAYESATPGVNCSDNTTVLLGDQGEPQPDLFMRILESHGGQSVLEKDYIVGPPELIGEIANTSRALDLHGKKDDYARYGVLEYVVAAVKEQQIFWFDLSSGKELQPDRQGIVRARTFPGLWINGPALFAHDHGQLMATLEEGLATPDHAAFVEKLAGQRATS